MIDAAQRARLDEACEIEHQLAQLGGDAPRLVRRLDDLTSDMMADGEDRLLRIAGALLVEHGLDHLFETIFARTRSDSWYEPGDGRRFLFSARWRQP